MMSQDPDFLTAVYIFVKYVVGLVFSTPFVLWNRRPMPCYGIGHCFPTEVPAAALAWVFVVVLLVRLLIHYTDGFRRKNTAITLAVFAVYLSLVPLYDGLSVLRGRSVYEQNKREMEERRAWRQRSTP